MNYYENINSQLEALKLKEIEKIFYEKIKNEGRIIPKVIPFKGVNTDMLYIKDNRVLFLKFMNTTDELFSILDEELLEIMKEEYDLLKIKMQQNHNQISYDYMFVMPYVNIDDVYDYGDFVEKNIIDRDGFEAIMSGKKSLDDYMNEENDEIILNLFLFDVCSEYYILDSKLHLNKDFKKISFFSNEYEYTATVMENSQIVEADSIHYGTTLYNGASGTGKTSLMLSRAIKLSKIYPHHKFLIITENKQSSSDLREKLEVLSNDISNLEIHTFGSFVFKLARIYNLVFDYAMLKRDYEKTFENIIKQAKNVIKNKRMFKGIFIDEAENFSEDQIKFLEEFLYKTKHIFNIFNCKTMNLTNNMNIFKNKYENIHIDKIVELKKNYRQTGSLVDFSNKLGQNADNYYKKIRPDIKRSVFLESEPIRDFGKNQVALIKVSDLDDQISSVIWEIEYFVDKKGLDYSDIAIIYPFNKKRLKNGKTIYFQYMIKKALDDAGIEVIVSDENLTSLSRKNGVTISNIYTVKSLEFKAVIICELEMLYNQKIADTTQDYQVNDFAGDINKVYHAVNRATDYVSFVTTFSEDTSDIIKVINDTVESEKIINM